LNILALSEFLLKIKSPAVPVVFPNNTVPEDPLAADVNLKYLAVGRLILPAKVAFCEVSIVKAVVLFVFIVKVWFVSVPIVASESLA